MLDLEIPVVDWRAGLLATKNLTHAGHRRIDSPGNPKLGTVSQRQAGYENVLQAAGLQPFVANSYSGVVLDFDLRVGRSCGTAS